MEQFKEPDRPVVTVEIQLTLTEEEYHQAQQASPQQLLEMALGQLLAGRKADDLNAWVFGPDELKRSLEIDTNYRCNACGARLYVLSERVLSRAPCVVEKICGECKSNCVEEIWTGALAADIETRVG